MPYILETVHNQRLGNLLQVDYRSFGTLEEANAFRDTLTDHSCTVRVVPGYLYDEDEMAESFGNGYPPIDLSPFETVTTAAEAKCLYEKVLDKLRKVMPHDLNAIYEYDPTNDVINAELERVAAELRENPHNREGRVDQSNWSNTLEPLFLDKDNELFALEIGRTKLIEMDGVVEMD